MTKNILMIHQKGPSQYKHIARHLHAQDDWNVMLLSHPGTTEGMELPRMEYTPAREPAEKTHWYIRGLESHILNGQAVVKAVNQLEQKGFRPDIILGHCGWGETLYLKDLWPDVPLISYFEWYYGTENSEINFDPEFPHTLDDITAHRTQNATSLLALQATDWGQVPTRWQWSRYPEVHRGSMTVVHDGIDTRTMQPNPNAEVTLEKAGIKLKAGDEVLTYISRNLEPFRGFHSFMRALPAIQKARPNMQTLIIGGPKVAYGSMPKGGGGWREYMLREVGDQLDMSRIHFLGLVSYATFVAAAQLSAVHVYLTYPFVLSWSMLEMMSVGTVVVGSKTPPVEEIIRHGENGLLVDFFKPQDIAEQVCAVLEHPDRMQHIRDRARQTILDQYDLHRICLPRQIAMIDDVINGRVPPQG